MSEKVTPMVFLKTRSDRLELQAPYHPSLPFRAGQLQGRWLGSQIGWTFRHDQEDGVRAICRDIWGVDGTEEPWRDLVDLEISVNEHSAFRAIFEAYEKPIYLVGREIAAALKNLKAARPGRGVHFLVGKPRCWRSVDTWWVSAPNGSVFVLRDVPRCTVTRFEEAIGRAGQILVKSLAAA